MAEERRGYDRDGNFDGLDKEGRDLHLPNANNCIQGAKFYSEKRTPPSSERAHKNLNRADESLNKYRTQVEGEIGDRTDLGM